MLIKTVIYKSNKTLERMEKTFQVKGSMTSQEVQVDRECEGERASIDFANQPEVDYLASYYSKDLLDF